VSDYGTDDRTTPDDAFLGGMVSKHFSLGNRRIPPYPCGYRNADIQHCAAPNLPRHVTGFNAIQPVSEY